MDSQKVVESFVFDGYLYFSRYKSDSRSEKLYGPYWYKQPVKPNEKGKYPQTYLGKLPADIEAEKEKLDRLNPEVVSLLKTKLESSLFVVNEFLRTNDIGLIESIEKNIEYYLGSHYLEQGE